MKKEEEGVGSGRLSPGPAALILLGMALAGCDIPKSEHAKWVEEYACSAEQLPAMEREFAVCRESQFDDAYCYGIAKRDHCSRRSEP